MSAPIAADFEMETLLAAVAAEGRPLDLSQVIAHADGWENVVLETGDGRMLRFPRDENVDFDREMRILSKLHSRLPVRIPVVEWTGRYTRFAAYRKLTGARFDRDNYLAASGWQQELLAASLARFLAAMHDSLSAAEIAELQLPTLDHEPTLDLVVREMRWLPAQHRTAVRGLIGEFADTWVSAAVVPGPAVVLHNDFHPGNMVFAEPVGELTGIWDFSNVQIGVPSFDLRYLDGAPRDLLERVAGHYQMLTKRAVDVRAAIVANRMEDLFDVLETRRTDLFEAAIDRWSRADAGH
jgi:aminoglycoside phosphotransferase (APT) family kinase protein